MRIEVSCSQQQHCVGLCSDTEAGEEDDVSDPEYNFMLEDIDDDDEEEIRNDKATKVSSMFCCNFYASAQCIVARGVMVFSCSSECV